MKLYIGNKNYSSWSMRPWVLMRQSGISFEELTLRFDSFAPDSSFKLQALALAPTGKVPLLVDEGLVIWDSLAICEYLAERFPGAKLWPADTAARALARSAAAEMHAGFMPVRRDLSMDVGQKLEAEIGEETAAAIRRIVALWRGMIGRFGGPFLAGEWSIADAFYTPVATRFVTYGVDLTAYGDDGTAARYRDLMLAQPEYLEWEQAALAEA